jgi:hypothetical protein
MTMTYADRSAATRSADQMMGLLLQALTESDHPTYVTGEHRVVHCICQPEHSGSNVNCDVCASQVLGAVGLPSGDTGTVVLDNAAGWVSVDAKYRRYTPDSHPREAWRAMATYPVEITVRPVLRESCEGLWAGGQGLSPAARRLSVAGDLAALLGGALALAAVEDRWGVSVTAPVMHSAYREHARFGIRVNASDDGDHAYYEVTVTAWR